MLIGRINNRTLGPQGVISQQEIITCLTSLPLWPIWCHRQYHVHTHICTMVFTFTLSPSSVDIWFDPRGIREGLRVRRGEVRKEPDCTVPKTKSIFIRERKWRQREGAKMKQVLQLSLSRTEKMSVFRKPPLINTISFDLYSTMCTISPWKHLISVNVTPFFWIIPKLLTVTTIFTHIEKEDHSQLIIYPMEWKQHLCRTANNQHNVQFQTHSDIVRHQAKANDQWRVVCLMTRSSSCLFLVI